MFPSSDSASLSASVFAEVSANIGTFTSETGPGVVCLVYSAILTRGINGIDGDKDLSDMTLINEHGYASQELINTMVTGKAASNCHDGDKDVGDNFIIKGIDR